MCFRCDYEFVGQETRWAIKSLTERQPNYWVLDIPRGDPKDRSFNRD
jgi:hypothetical protein